MVMLGNSLAKRAAGRAGANQPGSRASKSRFKQQIGEPSRDSAGLPMLSRPPASQVVGFGSKGGRPKFPDKIIINIAMDNEPKGERLSLAIKRPFFGQPGISHFWSDGRNQDAEITS